MSAAEKPRRTTSGVDSSRVAMVLAVLQQHAAIRTHNKDVFVSTVGGAKINEPASDLAVAISIASALYERPAPMGTVAMGEIGLAGELRRVRDLPQRLAEAACLGFAYALVPSDRTGGAPTGPTSGRKQLVAGVEVIEVPNIGTAMSIDRKSTRTNS